MNSAIKNFISPLQEKGEGYYTHISQIQPTGRYNIGRKDTEEFWKVYCDTLFKDGNMISGLAERPMDFAPVLNDTDIKIEYNRSIHFEDKKLYKDTHVKGVVMIYQKYLKQIIKNYSSKYGICFVLEKDRPSFDDKNRISHGFHLHFINTIMHKVDQDVHLIPRIRNEIKEKNLFKDLGIQNSEDVIDKSCTSKYWLLYGSRKKENLQSYKLSKIYDDECREITLEEALKDFNILDVHGDKITIDKPLHYYLPRILSIHPGEKEPVFLHTDLQIYNKKVLQKAKDSKKVYDDLPISEALKKARELLKLISPSRADVYEDWLDIGWTLYNIGDGTEEALDMWTDFSSKTTKKGYFSEKVCMYEWERMTKKNKTIGSLFFYAKIDSPEEYKKIQKKENDRLFNESLNGGHYDMAKWLHTKYRDEFVCACIEKNVWFRFKGHRWMLNKGGIDMRKKISTELVSEYKKLKKKICEDMGEEDDDAELQKKLKTVNKIIANLKSSPFKNSIMRECQDLFFEDGFPDKLDSNINLIHFTNGVLDLSTTDKKIREGRPSDYISLTTGYDFVEHKWTDLEVLDVIDHLSKVFPDPILRQYFIEYAANLLIGGNNIKTFLNMSGEGDNGKSINMDLMKLALGKYMKILPTSLITGKRTQSSQATPELSGIQGVRFAVLQEPNSKDVINVGILKELSGNDVIYVRGLYKDSQEVKPQFKLALICNKLPRLPCFTGDTAISLSCGISVSINKMNDCRDVFAWDNHSNGLIKTRHNALLDQGYKNCVQLTFTDGRTITCTPDHRFLSTNGEWIEARNIELCKTPIRIGIDQPKCDDIFETCNYVFVFGRRVYDTRNIDERMKAMALCRLMGLMITDGSGNRVLYTGHMLDAESIVDDIELVSGKRRNINKTPNGYCITIPSNMIEDLNTILELQTGDGGRINKPFVIPEFLFQKDTPKFLIREFIAGMFGGDGCIPCISRRKCGTIRFHCVKLIGSKTQSHVSTMVDGYTKIRDLIKDKFDIESFVSTPASNKITGNFEVFIKIIKHEDILKFNDNIGFRYCCHKAYRLSTMCNFIRYKNHYISLNNKLINRVKYFMELWRSYHDPKIIQLSLDGEIINTFINRKEAAIATGSHKDSISRVCQGKQLTAGKYKWKYDRDDNIEGFKTGKESYIKALDELEKEFGGIDREMILPLHKVLTRTKHDDNIMIPQVDIEEFLTKLDIRKYFNLINNTNQKNYAVDINRRSLPTHQIFVTGRKEVGEKKVYDLTVTEPYSSFVANGVVVHNCDDPAAWNRIRVLPHESSFPKDPKLVPETYEEQLKVKRFPRDPFFSEKLPKMKTAFMWIMVENYKRICIEGRMQEPEKVREATSVYRKNNDVFLQFIEERIINDEDNEKALISVVETYNAFKSWFNDSYPNLHFQIPSKEDMKEELIKKWGDLTKGYKWKGYRLRTPEDDEREGKAIIIREEDLADETSFSNDCDDREDDTKFLKDKKKNSKKSNKKEIVIESEDENDYENESEDEIEIKKNTKVSKNK